MTKIRTIKVGQDAITGGKNPHYALVAGRKVIATGTKDEMLELNQKTDGRVWLTHAKVDEIVEAKGPCWDTHKQVGMKKKGNRMVPNCVPKEAFPAAAVGLALKAAPTVARVVSRGSGAPIGAAATSAINTAKKGYRKLKKRFSKKTNEDIATATTTASIPNPAVTAMGPTFKTTNMTDRRYKKKGLPVLLKRFRKYIEDNGG
jgi:hypothetical protein|tara:strand:- start:102 stop:710 length:609 start_codon:yes stop_codon:yes gene_type:complete